jgi:tripartite-type tricarboxylate transporter receptor subunit TctC
MLNARYGFGSPLTGILVGTLMLLIGGVPAHADDYPNRPLRFVVPTAAGSSPDILARLLQPYLEKALKQPVVIDNRAGASTMIGTDAVAKANPDGYTLLVVNTTFTVNGALNSKMAFDPQKDLEPIALLVQNPLVFAINSRVPAKSLKEFIDVAKAQPGKLNYGTPGASTQSHLLIEMWSERAGVKLQHIPYRGGSRAAMSVVAGETQLVLMSPVAVLGHAETGVVRALATGGLKRDPKMPGLPTVAESGFPGFEAVQWFGLLTTGGTPKAIVDRLNTEINRALNDPELIRKLEAQGATPIGGPPEQFKKLIATEIRNWKETARAAGIKAK